MFRSLLARPHHALAEMGALAALYALYESVRGAGGASLETARRHTDDIVGLERALHVFHEQALQWVVPRCLCCRSCWASRTCCSTWQARPPRCAGSTATGATRFRSFARRSSSRRRSRSSATCSILRLRRVSPASGSTTRSRRTRDVNLSSDALGALYNPYAAVPSLHFGYALLVGGAVRAPARRRWMRIVGALYPAFMLFDIVATGNHLLFDAAAGGIVVAAGALVARRLVAEPAPRPALRPLTA